MHGRGEKSTAQRRKELSCSVPSSGWSVLKMKHSTAWHPLSDPEWTFSTANGPSPARHTGQQVTGVWLKRWCPTFGITEETTNLISSSLAADLRWKNVRLFFCFKYLRRLICWVFICCFNKSSVLQAKNLLLDKNKGLCILCLVIRLYTLWLMVGMEVEWTGSLFLFLESSLNLVSRATSLFNLDELEAGGRF